MGHHRSTQPINNHHAVARVEASPSVGVVDEGQHGVFRLDSEFFRAALLQVVAIFASSVSMKLEPAFAIINKLGGIDKVASHLGVHRTRVWNWMRPKHKGGSGGTIPQRHHLALLDMARAQDKPLTAAEFLPRPQQVVSEDEAA